MVDYVALKMWVAVKGLRSCFGKLKNKYFWFYGKE